MSRKYTNEFEPPSGNNEPLEDEEFLGRLDSWREKKKKRAAAHQRRSYVLTCFQFGVFLIWIIAAAEAWLKFGRTGLSCAVTTMLIFAIYGLWRWMNHGE